MVRFAASSFSAVQLLIYFGKMLTHFNIAPPSLMLLLSLGINFPRKFKAGFSNVVELWMSIIVRALTSSIEPSASQFEPWP